MLVGAPGGWWGAWTHHMWDTPFGLLIHSSFVMCSCSPFSLSSCSGASPAFAIGFGAAPLLRILGWPKILCMCWPGSLSSSWERKGLRRPKHVRRIAQNRFGLSSALELETIFVTVITERDESLFHIVDLNSIVLILKNKKILERQCCFLAQL